MLISPAFREHGPGASAGSPRASDGSPEKGFETVTLRPRSSTRYVSDRPNSRTGWSLGELLIQPAPFTDTAEAQGGCTTPWRSQSHRTREKVSSQPRPFASRQQCRPNFSCLEPSQLWAAHCTWCSLTQCVAAPGTQRHPCPCSLKSGHDPYLWSKTQLPQAAFQDYGPISIISFTNLLIHSMYIPCTFQVPQ